MFRLDFPFQSLQSCAHLRGGLIASLAIFFERSANDLFEFRGEARIHLPRRSRQLREDGLLKLGPGVRSEEHTSELQSHLNLVCRLLLEKKINTSITRACSIVIGSNTITLNATADG